MGPGPVLYFTLNSLYVHVVCMLPGAHIINKAQWRDCTSLEKQPPVPTTPCLYCHRWRLPHHFDTICHTIHSHQCCNHSMRQRWGGHSFVQWGNTSEAVYVPEWHLVLGCSHSQSVHPTAATGKSRWLCMSIRRWRRSWQSPHPSICIWCWRSWCHKSCINNS